MCSKLSMFYKVFCSLQQKKHRCTECGGVRRTERKNCLGECYKQTITWSLMGQGCAKAPQAGLLTGSVPGQG